MTLLTISDYYRERYGRAVDVVCSLIIILSYLGWVSAQVTALGLVFNLLSDGVISVPLGMVLGTASILAYTLFGGMLIAPSDSRLKTRPSAVTWAETQPR